VTTATGETVAILGVGAMGHGMAASVLRAGLPTIVWDRHREATRDLAERGAEVAETAADAAGRAGILVTMVPDAAAVISVARDQGVLAALAPEAIWAQMSTIGLAGINDVMAMVERERPDVTVLDAPVSGSKDPAEQGQLIIFASGPDEARRRVTPLFDALGRRTVWVGAAGAGTRLKARAAGRTAGHGMTLTAAHHAADRRMLTIDPSAMTARAIAQPRVARKSPNACAPNPTATTGTVRPT
jgi:3-hydroxyisobutyrate dehydrogenase